MAKVSLLYSALQSGRLGPLAPNMSARQVRRILGEPYERGRRYGMLWYYGDEIGDLEVMFEGPIVNLIMVTFWKRSKPVLPSRLLQSYTGFPSFRSYAAITRYLRRNGFNYVKNRNLTFGQQTTIECVPREGDSRIQMIFDRESHHHLAKLLIGRRGVIGAAQIKRGKSNGSGVIVAAADLT